MESRTGVVRVPAIFPIGGNMPLNVLVVDDSSVMRSIVMRTLRLSGLPLNEVVQAENGRQALDILAERWIDLALVDINMPVMNGIEMIDRVRQTSEISDLPIIVVSTEGSTTRIEMLKQMGVGFVHKPFTAETLREAVIELTGVSLNEQTSDESF
jgi:two-component system chemotaxis response regulator CheY